MGNFFFFFLPVVECIFPGTVNYVGKYNKKKLKKYKRNICGTIFAYRIEKRVSPSIINLDRRRKQCFIARKIA